MLPTPLLTLHSLSWRPHFSYYDGRQIERGLAKSVSNTLPLGRAAGVESPDATRMFRVEKGVLGDPRFEPSRVARRQCARAPPRLRPLPYLRPCWQSPRWPFAWSHRAAGQTAAASPTRLLRVRIAVIGGRFWRSGATALPDRQPRPKSLISRVMPSTRLLRFVCSVSLAGICLQTSSVASAISGSQSRQA